MKKLFHPNHRRHLLMFFITLFLNIIGIKFNITQWGNLHFYDILPLIGEITLNIGPYLRIFILSFFSIAFNFVVEWFRAYYYKIDLDEKGKPFWQQDWVVDTKAACFGGALGAIVGELIMI
jgi:hypothetical protein